MGNSISLHDRGRPRRLRLGDDFNYIARTNSVSPKDYDPDSFPGGEEDRDAIEGAVVYQDSERDAPSGWLSPSHVSVAMGTSLPSTSSSPTHLPSALPRPPPPPPPLTSSEKASSLIQSTCCCFFSSSDNSEYSPVMGQSARRLRRTRQRRRCLIATGFCSFLVLILIGILRGGGGGDEDNGRMNLPGKDPVQDMNATTERGNGGLFPTPNPSGEENKDVAPSATPTLRPTQPANAIVDDSLDAISPTVIATTKPSRSPTTAPSFLPTAVTISPTESIKECPVCFGQGDETAELPFPYARLYPDTENFITCNGLKYRLDELVATSSDPDGMCLEYQVTASIRCGCDTYPHPKSYCTLCPDGSLPPQHVLDRSTPIVASDDPTMNLTCADLIWSAAVFDSNQEPACSTIIVPQWARYCECPGFGGGPAEKADREDRNADFDMFRLDTLAEPTSPPTVSPNSSPCTLCSDGSTVLEEFRSAPIGVATVGDNYKEYTCGEGEVDIALFHTSEDTECGIFQLLGQLHCGCPETLQVPQQQGDADSCSLCPNGEIPPNLTPTTTTSASSPSSSSAGASESMEQDPSLYCFESYLEAAKRKRTSASCLRIQEDYGPACGCSPGAFEQAASTTSAKVKSYHAKSVQSSP